MTKVAHKTLSNSVGKHWTQKWRFNHIIEDGTEEAETKRSQVNCTKHEQKTDYENKKNQT